MERWTLAQRIRRLREEDGKSQTDVAEVLGISRQAYARLENGIRDITLIEIQQIANYFNIDYRLLLKEVQDADVSLIALCRNEQPSDNTIVFDKVEKILGVFLAQEKLFHQMKDRKGHRNV